jgi:site-specific recombinase XerD
MTGRRPASSRSTLSFPAAFQRYRHHLQVERQRRLRTIAAARYVLWDWHGWLAAKGTAWQRATRRDVGRWLDRPTRSGRAAGARIGVNTREHYLTAVRSFYRWAERERLIGRGRDPTAGIAARGAAPVPRALPVADLRTVLVAAEHDSRLEVMVALGYFCGLRAAEIANCRVEDIHTDDQPRILVHGKGGRDRVVPLHPQAERVLRRHLALDRRRVGPLVVGRGQSSGRPMTPGSVSRALSEHLRALGIQASGHALRHSAATEMLRAARGRNLEDVREFLGHADTRTTRPYILAYNFDVADAVAVLPDPRAGPAAADCVAITPIGLAGRVPVEVRVELAAAVQVLDEHAPVVARALQDLGRATTAAWLATSGNGSSTSATRVAPASRNWA